MDASRAATGSLICSVSFDRESPLVASLLVKLAHVLPRASAHGMVGRHSRCAVASPIGSADHAVSFRASERIPLRLGSQMSKKPTGAAPGDSEAMRIYERMEEERLRKLQAKAEANKPKKVTLPKLKFLDEK
jgi:hypothetical protein